jgi:hypothetical protein
MSFSSSLNAVVYEKKRPEHGFEVALLDKVPSPQEMKERAARKLYQFLGFPGQIQALRSFVDGLGDCNYLLNDNPQFYLLTTEGYSIPRLRASSIQSYLDRNTVVKTLVTRFPDATARLMLEGDLNRITGQASEKGRTVDMTGISEWKEEVTSEDVVSEEVTSEDVVSEEVMSGEYRKLDVVLDVLYTMEDWAWGLYSSLSCWSRRRRGGGGTQKEER